MNSFHPNKVPTIGLFFGVTLSLIVAESLAQSPAQLTYQQIFKENAPAVVLIRMVDSSKKIISLGSGFVVSPTGVIITNHHVIKAKPDARLEIKMPNGDVYTDVWIIHEEERRDLAVLWIKTTRLPTVKLGDSDNVEVGGTGGGAWKSQRAGTYLYGWHRQPYQAHA
jgi:S1-C subfamily serine protease